MLGASLAGAALPAGQRRLALAVGAGLGTLPDLDVLIDYGDAVANFTRHRGFSHSLLVLLPFSVLLWLALRRWWAPVRDRPGPWLLAISLALLTHPLLDAHTAYGTQLFWPLPVPPTMWSTLFIIDPLYTLPLVVATLVAAFRPRGNRTTTVLRAGVLLSTLYLGWSWTAKLVVEADTRVAMAGIGLEDAPLFSTPTPFNTLLWRVVVLTDDGYLEGFESWLGGRSGVRLEAYRTDRSLLEQAAGIPAVGRLRWFARDFLRADVVADKLLIADLRMGQEPYYVFTHVVAERSNPGWEPVASELIPLDISRRAIAETWQRLSED